MAISKTDFINYTRCPRYAALEEIHSDKLSSDMSLEEYLKQEENEKLREMLSSIFEETEEEEIDHTTKVNPQLEVMLPFYKQVEIEAARIVAEKFGGQTIFSENTYRQESFDFNDRGIRYLCYVDIYNEKDEVINIVEVKATTCSKYRSLEYGKRGEEKYPLFIKKDGIFHLSECINNDDAVLKNYEEKKAKLKNRFKNEGKYIYDLAVQRYIIEHDMLQNNNHKEIHYYLATLNSAYIYDGYEENGKNFYHSVAGEELITLFNLDTITKEMQNLIEIDKANLEKYLLNPDDKPCSVGNHCEFKQNSECKYKFLCFKKVPEKNASFNYIGFRQFKDENNVVYNKYDLINNGYYHFNDIPYEWLKNDNHLIQRESFDNNTPYIDYEKINAALGCLQYPIYHLDFESFACPIPRFKGETPYMQSCFEFSLHIEHEPGVCDKEKDNYVFLAKSFNDEREELVKSLVQNIDITKGTMLAQNVSFEKGRLKELANIFPEYKNQLLKICENSFDLLYIIRNNSSLFEELGFDKKRASLVNYYNLEQSGSYSIKKTLPLFTDLKYSNLEVQNGNEAQIAYALFNELDKEELNKKRTALIKYCQQDTWAMVEILRGLRELMKEGVGV